MKECREPLISIIVPVYQVKEYLDECVESLLAQTYTNLELLLVDDGSTDGSGEICDRYAVKDDRVRVVHQENQGPSAARNAGLDCAKGKYVAFVDSDDIVLPDFIEVLYELMRNYQADIATCTYVKCTIKNMATVKKELSAEAVKGECGDIDTNGGLRHKNVEGRGKGPELCMSSEQWLRQWHGSYKKWETVVWNKLYRKSIFDEGQVNVLRFPVGRKLEDVLTSHLIVDNAKRIALTTRRLYLYRIRSESRASQSRTVELMDENLRAQRERMAFFKERRYFRAYLNLWVGYMLHWGWFGWMRVKKSLKL